MKPNFDIDLFCDVIDNYGDAGVAWRIAKALAFERQLKVRLFINKPQTLSAFVKQLNAEQLPQLIENKIQVRHWNDCLSEDVSPVVIETFGCRLPERFEEKLCSALPTPLWINIEYLSAESWVEGCHLLPSPHPKFGIPKYFFFPGFTDKTGGVIIEHDLLDRQKYYSRQRENFLSSFNCDPSKLLVLIFCYPTAPLGPLIEALEKSQKKIQLLLCPGEASEQIIELLGDKPHQNLSFVSIPMVDQEKFDNFLFFSDLLIVRGEDSFVRAQLAAKPFIWNIYPQKDDVHIKKLEAFLNRIAPFLGEKANTWVKANLDFNNNPSSLCESLPAMIQSLQKLTADMLSWRTQLLKNKSLIDNLCNFINYKLK